jgi:hypothetical protein
MIYQHTTYATEGRKERGKRENVTKERYDEEKARTGKN